LKNIRILRVTVVLLGMKITMVFWDGAETENIPLGNQRLGHMLFTSF
jgi:hypothetical protein